jgi:hypothetical protein
MIGGVRVLPPGLPDDERGNGWTSATAVGVRPLTAELPDA